MACPGTTRKAFIVMIKDLVEETAGYVKGRMQGEASGHDWWHVYRVWQMAIRIGKETGANMTVVQLGALLHDIADWKFHDGDTEIGPRMARQWLDRCHADRKIADHVCDIVATASFKGAGTPDIHTTLESQVVQDADRLDAIGAIGIARTFAFGGARGREICDPEIGSQFHDSPESYRTNSSPTVNHFHEKLFLLKDRMNTDFARQIAAGRHRYMEDFIAQFHREWNGEL
jgi:uncharacterized protein